MNDVLRIACLKIALQRAFLRRAILIFTQKSIQHLITILKKNVEKLGQLSTICTRLLKVRKAH